MSDVLTSAQRKKCMSAIRARDTSPERAARRIVTELGYRYRLHNRALPGCPDIVLNKLRKVIFVHGCFWHRHRCKYGSVTPRTNASFWRKKLLANAERDKRNKAALRAKGWKVFVVWECQLRSKRLYTASLHRIAKFLAQ